MIFDNQHLAIFGGGAGMGFAIAQAAIHNGASVTILGRSETRLQEAAARLGSAARYQVADFTDAAALAQAATLVGDIDHLVLGASSHAAFGAFKDVDENSLRKSMDNKLIGYWLAAQAFVPKIAPTGSILMITGAAHRAAIPGMAAVAAVNAGIAGFAQVLAAELAPIRVNILSPGMVDTEAYAMIPDDARQEMYDAAASKLPVGRIGKPEDIAGPALSLMSSGFMTGAILDVDGGVHLARG